MAFGGDIRIARSSTHARSHERIPSQQLLAQITPDQWSRVLRRMQYSWNLAVTSMSWSECAALSLPEFAFHIIIPSFPANDFQAFVVTIIQYC